MRPALLALCLLAGSTLAQPAPWRLDTAASELVVKVWKTGAGASLAHDHVVRASRFSGTAALDDSGKPESLRLALEVDVAGLVPDEGEIRRRHHLPNTPVPPGDVAKVRATMLGADQLDVARYPTISFASSRVFRDERGARRGVGRLTLHGVTKELQFPLVVKTGNRHMEGDATVRFKTSDFGVKPYSAALGLIRNRDEVELVLHVVLKR